MAPVLIDSLLAATSREEIRHHDSRINFMALYELLGCVVNSCLSAPDSKSFEQVVDSAELFFLNMKSTGTAIDSVQRHWQSCLEVFVSMSGDLSRLEGAMVLCQAYKDGMQPPVPCLGAVELKCTISVPLPGAAPA